MVKTPQQNGVVERKHRHLLDTARAIRLHAGFPKHFWGECVLAATHIINKLPMAVLGWKTLFEVLYGSAPDLSDLRTIGCLCYATKLGETDKLEARAHKCVLLGYTYGFKGYKLYDLQSKKVFHSRDVVFQEGIFPFQVPSHSSTHDDSFSSFFWPHSEVPPASPRQLSSISTPVPVHDDRVSVPSENSAVSPVLEGASDPSPTSITHTDVTQVPSHPPAAQPGPVLRRSARSKVAPTWL